LPKFADAVMRYMQALPSWSATTKLCQLLVSLQYLGSCS